MSKSVLASLTAVREDLQKSLAALRAQDSRSALQKRIADLEKQVQSARSGGDLSTYSTQQLVELSNVTELSESDLRELAVTQDKQVRELRQRNLKLIDRQTRLEDEIEALKAQYAGADRLIAENDSLKQQVATLKAMNVSQFNENMEDQIKRAKDFERERESLEEQMDEVRRNKARLERENADFEAKNATLHEKERELEAKLFAFQAQIAAREDEHRAQLEALTAEREAAEARLRDQEAKVRAKEDEYRDIAQKVERELARKHDAQITELNEKLQLSKELLLKYEKRGGGGGVQTPSREADTDFRKTMAEFEVAHIADADSDTQAMFKMMREEFEQALAENDRQKNELQNELITLQQLLTELDFNFFIDQIVARARERQATSGSANQRTREEAYQNARQYLTNEIRYMLSRLEVIASEYQLKYGYQIEE